MLEVWWDRSHLRGTSSSWRYGKAFCDFQLNGPKKRGAIVTMGFSSAVGAQQEKGFEDAERLLLATERMDVSPWDFLEHPGGWRTWLV